MKNLKRKIFLGILIFVLIVFGIEIYSEYMANHSYYHTMLKSWQNRKLIIGVIVSGFIPLAYAIWTKKFSLKWFVISLFGGLFLFSLIHVSNKAEVMGAGGFVILLVNTFLLFALGIYFMLGSLSFGSWISDKLLKFKETGLQEMFINFGIGLGALLFVVRYLIISHLFMSALIWIFFIGLGVMIYLQRKKLVEYKEITEGLFENLNAKALAKNGLLIVGIVLLFLSIAYYFYGFQLSFIPYSTAWDANHAYMYFPKIWAQNNGVFRGNGPGGFLPGLWHSFIGIWFALFEPLKGFWLSADNIAVSMNFLSGILVLFFGLAVIKEVIGYVGGKLTTKSAIKEKYIKIGEQITFYGGWFGLLLWLTSGMGAFLVFVDNKTDLGVMSMIVLGMLSGFIFLRYISEHRKTSKGLDKETLKYIIVSGIMFSFGALAKPTALTDVALFALLIVALWFGRLIALGGGIALLGIVGKLQIANAKDMFSVYSTMPNYLMLAGILIMLVGIAVMILQNRKTKNAGVLARKNFVYFVVWGVVYVGMILISNVPAVAVNSMKNGFDGAGKFMKKIFLTQNIQSVEKTETEKLLLATTTDISEQNEVDAKVVGNLEMSLDECQTVNYDEEELEKGLREPPKSNEDVGRYVGYGYKTFNKPSGLFHLGYALLKLVYPTDMKCYGTNDEAKILCENKVAVEVFDVPTMRTLFDEMDPESEPYQLLSGALAYFDSREMEETDSNVASVMQTHIGKIRQYYEDHAANRDFNMQNIANAFNTVGALLSQVSDTNLQNKIGMELQNASIEIGNKYTNGNLKTSDLKKYSKELQESLKDIKKSVNEDDYDEARYLLMTVSDQVVINVPYRYLVPFNVVYNWSLQNLSSYYTDIGFVRLLFFIIIIVALFYGLVSNNKKLTSLALMATIGRGVWWIIGGAIVWYGIGLIMWTVLVFAILLKELFPTDEKNSGRALFSVVVGLMVMRGLIQFLFNLIRISSQGAGGPFVRYKMSAGNDVVTELSLSQKEETKYGFSAKDVFDLQFGHYNPFIELTNGRADEDGVLVAGTYLPYFLDNQTNLKYDGMLNRFWENTSDHNSCKSYQRLKAANLKYLVIDPNIATVVMGEGNNTLFYKFFAQQDPVSGLIEDHGALTMLVKMWKDGYLDLVASNNLGARYGFSLSDEEIKSAFFNLTDATVISTLDKMGFEYTTGAAVENSVSYDYSSSEKIFRYYGSSQTIVVKNISESDYDLLDRSFSFEDALIFTRAKLIFPNPRFFDDSNALAAFIAMEFDKRVSNGLAIGDIAAVYGYIIDDAKILSVAQTIIKSNGNWDLNIVADLSENERRVLSRYLQYYMMKVQGDSGYQQAVQSLLGYSIGSSSQYMGFELK